MEEGSVGLMDSKKIPRQPLAEDKADQASSDEIQELKDQVRQLQFEVDVMKEIVHVIKKDPGVNSTTLSNQEKTVIVDALQNQYSRSQLLNYLAFPRSSYYYSLAKQRQADKYKTLREMIQSIFQENRCAYGYRRIWAVLRKRGYIVSEKVVRRLMTEAGLQIAWRKKRRYRSYQGEVSPAVDN